MVNETLKTDLNSSGPEYPGMTLIEWDLLSCPGDANNT